MATVSFHIHHHDPPRVFQKVEELMRSLNANPKCIRINDNDYGYATLFILFNNPSILRDHLERLALDPDLFPFDYTIQYVNENAARILPEVTEWLEKRNQYDFWAVSNVWSNHAW